MNRTIDICPIFDESKAGVSKEHAVDVVRSPDKEVFLADGTEVGFEDSECGIYIRSFGGKASKRYTIIVITGTDQETQGIVIQAALRAEHRNVHIPDDADPITVLKAFLEIYGVELTIPGLGRSSLFLDGRLEIPSDIASEEQALTYLLHLLNDQNHEPCNVISNTNRDDAQSCILIRLLAFYSTERYGESLHSNRRFVKPSRPSFKDPFQQEKKSLRKEYEGLMKQVGQMRSYHDVDWKETFAEEVENAGLSGLLGIPDDESHPYQQTLDRVSLDVEYFIRERRHTLQCGVFVGLWPLGLNQASVSRAGNGNGVIVLVNQGMMKLLYQVAKIITRSFEFFKIGKDKKKSIAETMGWPAVGWTPQDTVEWLGETLAAYFTHGDIRHARRVPLSDPARTLFGIHLTLWAERFVVAHEYSHVLLDHLSGPLAMHSTPFGNIEVFGESQQNEFDADLAAVDLCLATANWSDGREGLFEVNVRVAGACLLFVVEVLLDGVRIGPHDFTENRPGSHPAPYCRIIRIMDHLERRYGGSLLFNAEFLRQWIVALIVPATEKAREIVFEEKKAIGGTS